MTVRSALLLNESPLVIIPSLATAIGLSEAVVVQQVHYWLERSSHTIDGRTWVYNSLPAWREQFPFWSQSTVKRTISRLEKAGILISGQYNRDTRDKTKWYTIDYERLDEAAKQSENPSGQNDLMAGSICTDGPVQNDPISSGQNDPTITRDYSRDYSENKNPSASEPEHKPPAEIDPELGVDQEMAEWMFDRVQKITPYQRKPNWRKWSDTIRLMRERDGIERSVIARVFAWANKDSFWKTNILSPDKLRKKFPELHAKYLESINQQSATAPGNSTADENRARKQKLRSKLRDIHDTSW